MEPALGGLIHPEMTGLIGLVFALGLRHGFDPDHLVAIDGMTRSSARVRPGTSRCVSVAIAFLCLALAAGGIAKYALPALEEHAAAFVPMLSVGSMLLISAAYALASRFAVLR